VKLIETSKEIAENSLGDKESHANELTSQTQRERATREREDIIKSLLGLARGELNKVQVY